MARPIIGLILAVLLAACTMAPTKPVPEPRIQDTQYYADWVCEQLSDACVNLTMPTIVYSSILDYMADPGTVLQGMHIKGEKYLFVNPDRDSMEEVEATLVHEMVHYVIEYIAPETEYCTHEYAARLLTARWLDEPYNDAWRALYDCEKEEEELEDDAVDDSR